MVRPDPEFRRDSRESCRGVFSKRRRATPVIAARELPGKTRIWRYRCAKVARRDGYSAARHSSWLFRLFIAIVWQTGSGTMADTVEQRAGRAGIAASPGIALVTSFVPQGCSDKETLRRKREGGAGKGSTSARTPSRWLHGSPYKRKITRWWKVKKRCGRHKGVFANRHVEVLVCRWVR